MSDNFIATKQNQLVHGQIQQPARARGMEWKGQLYVDTALPFGLRPAPMIFNAVAEALVYVIQQKGVDGLDH